MHELADLICKENKLDAFINIKERLSGIIEAWLEEKAQKLEFCETLGMPFKKGAVKKILGLEPAPCCKTGSYDTLHDGPCPGKDPARECEHRSTAGVKRFNGETLKEWCLDCDKPLTKEAPTEEGITHLHKYAKEINDKFGDTKVEAPMEHAIPDVKCDTKNCSLFYVDGIYKDCCVWCGKPRPEPRKALKLADILYESCNFREPKVSYHVFESCAYMAIKAVLEVVDAHKKAVENLASNRSWSEEWDQLKQRILEMGK